MEKTTALPQCLKKWLYSPVLPYVAFFVLMLAAHLTFLLVDGDEVMYARMFETQGIWGMTVNHFYTWSSRVFIEAVLALVSWLPRIVWRLLNPVVATVCVWCMAKLCGVEKDTGAGWVLCGLFVLYRWEYLNTAGWVATTLVFLWPAAAALFAMLPLGQMLRGEKPKLWQCVLSLPLLLYAANNEQIAVLYLLLGGAVLAYLPVKKRKMHWVLPVQLVMCLANIIYALAIPGPRMRTAAEMTQWYPDFGMRSFAMNADLGMTAALDSVLYTRDLLFAWLCALLAWAVWRRYKNVVYRLLALWPLAVSLVFGVFQRFTLAVFPQLAFFTEALGGGGIVSLHNVNIITAFIPLLLLYFTFAACLVNAYLAFGDMPRALCALALLFFGFLSRAMLGFSPTVWTSGIRTGFFFSLCTAAVCTMLFKQLKPVKGAQRVVFAVLFGASCLFQMYSLLEM